MSRKVYKIYRIGAPDIYKGSKAEVIAWCRRNPGEMERYEQVDVLTELDELAHDLFEVLNDVTFGSDERLPR